MFPRDLMVAALVLALGGCSDDSAPRPDQASGQDLRLHDLSALEPSVGDVARDSPQLPGPDGPVAIDLGSVEKGAALDQAKADKMAVPDGPAKCGKLGCDCTFFSTKQGKLIKLWGQAKETTTGILADFKIKVVTFNPQLKVKLSTTMPLKCGEWQPTTSALPAFTYQIVQLGEDFTVQFDQVFPGINTVACPSCK